MKKKLLKEEMFFSMTWDYLNVFLPSQHQDSPKTVKAYADGLTVFRRYLTDECLISIKLFQFEELTYDFILDYRIFLVEKGYKPNTVNHRLAIISAYMRYAALRRPDLMHIYMNVSEAPSVTVPSKIRDIIEDGEAIAMLVSAPGPSRIGIRDRIILVILYDTAIRADELLRLNFTDVNISCTEPYLRIHGKGDKERIVKKYGDMVKKAKPDIPSKIYPHMLRRTRACGWYRDGVPVETIAVILGHSDAKTTRKSYARPSVEMLRKEMEKGTPTEVGSAGEEQPLWTNDEELARLCGIR